MPRSLASPRAWQQRHKKEGVIQVIPRLTAINAAPTLLWLSEAEVSFAPFYPLLSPRWVKRIAAAVRLVVWSLSESGCPPPTDSACQKVAKGGSREPGTLRPS